MKVIVHKRQTHAGSEIADFMLDTVLTVLKQRGISPALASAAAVEAVEAVTAHFAGQQVYFRRKAEDGEERRAAIVADFASGHFTRGELAHKYGLSLQRIYQILGDAKR